MTDVFKRLFRRQRFGIRLGLENMAAMLERMGHPERECGVIHVAGTNGKGSVCAILETVLRASGFRTGLYTSPHLVNVEERYQVDGQPVSHADLVALAGEVETLADEVTRVTGQAPTFFECGTVIAFELFRRKGVQLAVVETGMGGRLDATNVVIPLVSVITSISLEHTEHLGASLAAIAAEKAGIIKKGHPVVCGALPDEALAVVRAVARTQGSALTPAAEQAVIQAVSTDLESQIVLAETANVSYGKTRYSLVGPPQRENLAMALTVLDVLDNLGIVPLDPKVVRQALARVRWPGRFQVVARAPSVVLDGAHNPGAARCLADTLAEVSGGRPVAMVVGLCRDKDVAGFFRALSGAGRRVWAVGFQGERALESAAVSALARQAGLDAQPSDLVQGLREAREWAQANEGLVCVCGSLFLVGEVLARAGEFGFSVKGA
jgi:dihydrofolate synthase/folylpolyglutamate synthase